MEPGCGREHGQPLHCDILRLVFKMLTLNDLKACRLVCKEWCLESSAVMREVASVVWITNVAGGRGRSASDFLELMKVEEEDIAVSVLPFKVYLSCSLDELPREFWEFCGAAITKMHLRVESSSKDAFRYAVFESCTNLKALKVEAKDKDGGNLVHHNELVSPFPPNQNPNLKSLTCWGPMVEGVSWMEIMSNFPAVEKFEATYKASFLAEFFTSLAHTRRDDDQCWKLNHLSFSLKDIRTPLAIVPVLEDLSLSLKTLMVACISGSNDVVALRRILAVHAPTLKDLSISGNLKPDSEVMKIFPLPNNAVFENVIKLHLNFVTLNSVTFLKSFPNLKMLKLFDPEKPSPQFAQEPVGKWIVSSCTELVLDLMVHFSPEDLRRLLSRLTNVEKLTADSCDNDEFAVICEVLTNLVELRLPDTSVDDAGISGLTEEDVKVINESEDELARWPNIMMAKPNISRLTKLQRLELSGYMTEGRVPGYTSAVIVQQLPQLQHLRMPEEVEVTGRKSNGSPTFVKLQVHPLWERLLAQFPWPSQEESPSDEEWPHND